MNEKKIIIIDGNSLINRAYYAMQKPMMTKDGLYTHAVYGFLNILSKAMKDYEPKYMAITFDRKAPTFRHLEYEDYKAGRRKMPLELAMQLEPLKDVLAAMKIKCYEMDGFEADDLIGTIAKRSEEQGLEPLIITGDKDALQLASDSISVLITKKGISEFGLYDRKAMIDEYGLTPEQFIDLKGVMGDKSDNIPGIPGIGIKGGTELIKRFGSVENMLAESGQIKAPGLRKKVEENANLALMSKRLATIDTNAPIEFKLEDCIISEPDYDALCEQYKRLEFNSFLKKLKRPEEGETSGREAEEPSGERINNKYSYLKVENDESLNSFYKAVEKEGKGVLKVFSDGNHRSIPRIYGICFTVNNVVYYTSGFKNHFLKAFCSVIDKLKPEIYGHELIGDYYALLANELILKRDPSGILFKTCADTAICSYVLESSRKEYKLNGLMNEYFHEDFRDEEALNGANEQLALFEEDKSLQYMEYAGRYSDAVLSLNSVLLKRTETEGADKVYREIELPLIEVLASMEAAGFMVDKDILRSIGKTLSERLSELENDIYASVGEEFNINSPQQLGHILFDPEKLGLPAGKKTQRGYSTSAETLEALKEAHPIINLILEYRTLAKLKGTYTDGLIPLIHEDGRIHAHFQQSVTATGRISCTEPNLQNIPVREALGRTIRKAFIAKEGCCLSGADYSQIELRILAVMSGEESLIEAFQHGNDIHRETASRVFNVPFDEVSKEQRSAAKAVNFGVIYGMSSFGLSSEIHVSRKEAERYIRDYFDQHPSVKLFMDAEIEKARERGYAETMMGRRRYIPEVNARAYMVRQLGERLAMNTPIQGSAADIIKLAMIRVFRRLGTEGLKAKLILQIHDELIIEAPEDEQGEVQRILREEMEGAAELPVRLEVDYNTAANWYELK